MGKIHLEKPGINKNLIKYLIKYYQSSITTEYIFLINYTEKLICGNF